MSCRAKGNLCCAGQWEYRTWDMTDLMSGQDLKGLSRSTSNAGCQMLEEAQSVGQWRCDWDSLSLLYSCSREWAAAGGVVLICNQICTICTEMCHGEENQA